MADASSDQSVREGSVGVRTDRAEPTEMWGEGAAWTKGRGSARTMEVGNAVCLIRIRNNKNEEIK
jgi:hypothetical protein